MHMHRLAEGVVRGHPLLVGLVPFLKRKGIEANSIEYVEACAHFAYPRAFWLKLAVDAPTALKGRHELNPELVGTAINEWLLRQDSFITVVFDFRDVTIFDLEHMRTLCDKIKAKFNVAYLCDDQLKAAMSPLVENHETLFHTEEELLVHLRTVGGHRCCRVVLPEGLTGISLNDAMKAQAEGSHLRDCGSIVFDFGRVSKVDFTALSLLSPLIHSIAHKHGMLADLVTSRANIAAELQRFKALLPVTSYLFRGLPFPSESKPNRENGLEMTAFTRDDLSAVLGLCDYRFYSMARTNATWFVGPTARANWSAIDRKGEYIRVFMQILKELAENVAYHAYGVGYIAFQLQPKFGLSIYVGDTGVGLARGISLAYHLRIKSEAKAVGMALLLSDHLERRRHLPGTLRFGGRGLERVAIILERLRGHISVRSGPAMAEFQPYQSRKPVDLYTNLYNIQGTHIHVFIPTR